MISASLLFIGAVLFVAAVIPVVHSSLLENKLDYLEALDERGLTADEVD